MQNTEKGGWLIFKDINGKRTMLKASAIIEIKCNGEWGVKITTIKELRHTDSGITPKEYPGEFNLWIGAIKEAMSYPPHEYLEINNCK